MGIKNLLLIIIAGIHSIIGIILILKNYKNSTNISLALMTFGAALWSFAIAMFNSTLDMSTAVIWAKLYYFGSAIIVLSFLYLANYYLYVYSKSEESNLLLLIPLLIIIFVIFHPTLLIEQATHYDWGNDANEKLSGHLFYALYFFSYIIWAYLILYRKLKKSEGFLRSNLLKVIYVTLIGFIFGFTFDLILPILGNYKLIWVGPYFTVFFVFYLADVVFKKQKN